jgi:hypothetical protein
MPRELKSVEWPERTRDADRDWDLLTDGKARAFKPGKEFSDYGSFKVCAYQAARRRGMFARIKRNERGEAIVQFFTQETK